LAVLQGERWQVPAYTTVARGVSAGRLEQGTVFG